MSAVLTRAALVVAGAAVGGGATLGGVWLTTGFGTVALPPVAVAGAPHAVAGPPRLRIGSDALAAGGIIVARLGAANFRPARRTYARVIDPTALFTLQSQLADARAALVAAQGQAELSRQEYARDQSLFAHHQSVSQQALLTAKTAETTDAQRLAESQTALDNVQARLRSRFGPALVAGAGAEALLGKLQNGQAALVAVTLPTGKGTAPSTNIILETESGETVPATYLSPAPARNPKAPGRAAYYVAARGLETGSQPLAQVVQGPARAGVFLPRGAVIWFGGERWLYVADGNAGFRRRALPGPADLQRAPGGYVAAGAFKPGERIVTRGAQLLLSQEIKPKDIKTECPDPPECDG